jgi:glycosyltransferase involved in cell wall biosynthesis
MAARGHPVTVVTDAPRGDAPGPVDGDPPAVAVHRLGGYRALLADSSKIPWEQMAFGVYPELCDVLDQAKPDVVLTNSLDSAVMGKTVALALEIPWVATFHEQAPEREPLGLGRLRLAYGQLRPSLVLAGSRFYASRAERFGARAELIYHGVDTDVFHPGVDRGPARQAYGYASHHVVIVCAGRLKERKGILQALHAFGSVHAAHPETRLLVVGSLSSASADYAALLESETDRLGLRAAVTIDRTVTFDQMPGVLAAADIVAQPSLEEGLGLAVLEAMSSERAVVTTDIPGIREILTAPDIALVVPPGQAGPLAAALERLVVDARTRAALAAHGRAHVVEHFSRSRMMWQTEAVLRMIVDSGPSAWEAEHL